jgi:hypothetical protein
LAPEDDARGWVSSEVLNPYELHKGTYKTKDKRQKTNDKTIKKCPPGLF